MKLEKAIKRESQTKLPKTKKSDHIQRKQEKQRNSWKRNRKPGKDIEND